MIALIYFTVYVIIGVIVCVQWEIKTQVSNWDEYDAPPSIVVGIFWPIAIVVMCIYYGGKPVLALINNMVKQGVEREHNKRRQKENNDPL